MIWNCPSCHGDLQRNAANLHCAGCAATYPLVCGVPDLRLLAPTWIDFEKDRRRAEIVNEISEQKGVEHAIYDVFRNSRHFSHDKSLFRVKQVYAGMEKYNKQIDGWLRPAMNSSPILDLGCGPGLLSIAAARRGMNVAGLDVSIEWLVVAKHLISANGGAPELAAGLAQALPIKSGSLGGFVSLDVIEHVGDQQGYVNEIRRVLAPDGCLAISTPNRFSLSPEPHVGVWGVGFLPVSLQAPWVKIAGGVNYEFTRLLSVNEAKRLFNSAGIFQIKFDFPPISDEEIEIFSGVKALLARLYNRIVRNDLLKKMAPFFGAYYRVTGKNEHLII